MIRYIILSLTTLMFFALSFSATYVNGYTKKDGTYVSGYYRTSANNTTDDNYSTSGNTNLFTGENGTKKDTYDENSSFTTSSTWVDGHYTKKGNYIPGHYKRD